jgi:hypothetical protein
MPEPGFAIFKCWWGRRFPGWPATATLGADETDVGDFGRLAVEQLYARTGQRAPCQLLKGFVSPNETAGFGSNPGRLIIAVEQCLFLKPAGRLKLRAIFCL